MNLIGKKDEPMLQFDIDLGMRVDVEKRVAPELGPCCSMRRYVGVNVTA